MHADAAKMKKNGGETKGHGEKFGRKKDDAIAALLSHRSVDDAARAVGLNPSTLLRWLQKPEFRAEYRKARREAVGQTTARLQQATGAAGAIVLKLMTDPNAPASVRLRAAECVLDRAIKSLEMEDMEDRISELERAAEANQGRGK
jgi:transposase-like protein